MSIISSTTKVHSDTIKSSDGLFKVTNNIFDITNDGTFTTYTLKDDVTVSATTDSYQPLYNSGGNIIYDGNGHTISVNADGYYGNYTGFLRIDKNVSNITIKNFFFSVVSSGVRFESGYLAGTHFGERCTNIIVENCFSDGDIIYYGGGLIGSWCASDGGEVTINNCGSVGQHARSYTHASLDAQALTAGGGIVGAYAGYGRGTVICNNCFSTGTIENGGGIFGPFAGFNSSDHMVQANYCHSTGEITGDGAGGIFGPFAGGMAGDLYASGVRSSCSATSCYSTGNITGTSCGGIVGSNAGYSKHNTNLTENGRNNVRIDKCFSIGTIQGYYSGGITGNGAGNKGGIVTINECYSRGNIAGRYNGGISGTYTCRGENANHKNGKVTISSCYTEGSITGYGSGGICGAYVSSDPNSGKTEIYNCFTMGQISQGNSGGIVGIYAAKDAASNSSLTITNCFTLNDTSNRYFYGTNYGSNIVVTDCSYGTTWDPTSLINVIESRTIYYTRDDPTRNEYELSWTKDVENKNLEIYDTSDFYRYSKILSITNQLILKNTVTHSGVFNSSYGNKETYRFVTLYSDKSNATVDSSSNTYNIPIQIGENLISVPGSGYIDHEDGIDSVSSYDTGSKKYIIVMSPPVNNKYIVIVNVGYWVLSSINTNLVFTSLNP